MRILFALSWFAVLMLAGSCGRSGRVVSCPENPVTNQSVVDRQLEMERLRDQVDAKNQLIAQLRNLLAHEVGPNARELVVDGAGRLRNAQNGVVTAGDLRPNEEVCRITLLDSVLFDSGDAGLSEDGVKTLESVSEYLLKQYPGREIVVRGHTDSEPIDQSPYKSNWELGAARALRVLHFLVDVGGLAGDSLSAQTFGQRRPRAGNDSAMGKQLNRRTEIVVMPALVEVEMDRQ